MWMVEYCHTFPLFIPPGRLLVNGGHANTQTEGEIVTKNSRLKNCKSGENTFLGS